MFASSTRRKWLLAAAAAVVIVIAVLGYGYAETYRLEVKEYELSFPDLPAAFDGTRVALVTDIHRGPFFSEERVESVVERVNALEPDLIALGGDYVFASTDYAASCFAQLGDLKAPLGRFAVLGNHDYGKYDEGEEGPALVIEGIEDSGITLLRETGEWLYKGDERILIGGVSDYDVGRPRLDPALEDATEDDFILLLSHNPDYVEELPEGAVDLVLSGHTHGGQVTVFGLWAPYVPSENGQKYRTGLVEADTATVVVSNGVGTSTYLPVRLFARPQIVVITLRSGEPALSGADLGLHL